MAPVKGVPEVDPSKCHHAARHLKGGGNGHKNWFHCAMCKSRWNLSRRRLDAGKFVPESPQGAAEGEGPDDRDDPRRSPAATGGGQVVERGPASSADMSAGNFLEFERAEENLTMLETNLGDLDQTTQNYVNYVRAMVSEYRRLKHFEEETRHQSRAFSRWS